MILHTQHLYDMIIEDCEDGKDSATCTKWKSLGWCATSSDVRRDCLKTCGLCGSEFPVIEYLLNSKSNYYN